MATDIAQPTILVVPCYNEGGRFDSAQVKAFLDGFRQVKLLFVNDGSIDRTSEVLEASRKDFPDRIKVLNLSQNRGKAEAVRLGINEVLTNWPDVQQAKYIGYWDADFSVPLEDLTYFYAFVQLEQKDPQIIIGSRLKRMGSTVVRHWWRHYLGRVFATFASLILKMPVYDTQCGAKVFTLDVARTVFQKEFVSPWFFDIEVLGRWRQHCEKIQAKLDDFGIFEVPVRRWLEKPGSKLTARDFFKAPLELAKIYMTLNERPPNGSV